jgi:hypothetical protein
MVFLKERPASQIYAITEIHPSRLPKLSYVIENTIMQHALGIEARAHGLVTD